MSYSQATSNWGCAIAYYPTLAQFFRSTQASILFLHIANEQDFSKGSPVLITPIIVEKSTGLPIEHFENALRRLKPYVKATFNDDGLPVVSLRWEKFNSDFLSWKNLR